MARWALSVRVMALILVEVWNWFVLKETILNHTEDEESHRMLAGGTLDEEVETSRHAGAVTER